MPRTVDIFLRVGLEMMKTMVADPGDRITGQTYRRAGGENKFQPSRHLKPAVGKVAMQVEGGAESHPEIDAGHDRQVDEVKASPDRGYTKKLQQDENRKNGDIKLFVFEHNRGLSRLPADGRERP